MLFLINKSIEEREKERMKSLGKASLGGPWELVDHTGKVHHYYLHYIFCIAISYLKFFMPF